MDDNNSGRDASAGPFGDDLLSKITEASPVGLAAVDREGVIVVANAAVERLFGYARNELLGQKVEVLVPAAFAADHPRLRRGYFDDPTPRAMGTGRDLFGVHKRGHEVPVEIGLTPLDTESGSFVLASIVDLTDRKRLEAELRLAKEASDAHARGLGATQASLQMILDAIPSWVFLKDNTNQILQVNKSVLDVLGCTREEVEGSSTEKYFPDQADRYYADDLAVLRSGKPRLAYVEPFLDRWIQTDKIPLANPEGEFDRILAVATDITELKRLTDSERSLQRLMDKASQIAQVGGWEIDLRKEEGPTWSPEVCRIHELPAGHRPGLQEAIEFYSSESRDLIQEVVRRGIEYHESWDVQATIITAKGNKRRVRAAGEPEVVDGKCVRLWGTLQDITEQSEAARQLQLTQRTVDKSADAIFFIRNDGRFSYVNEQASRNLGYSREELCEMSVSDIIPSYPKEKWPEHWEETREAGQLVFESQHQRKDGSFYDCELRKLFIEFEGEPLIVGLVRDITESKRADAALRASEARYRTLYEESPLMHANVDPETAAIKECNHLLVDRLGYQDKSEVIGKPIFSVYHESCHEGVREAFQQFIKSGRVENFELTLATKQGGRIPVILNVAAVRGDQGEILYSSSTWSDVTDLKKYTTDLEQANAELERFAYVASHDLKAPLRAIDHIATWLNNDLAGRLPEASETHLSQLRQRVLRMDKLLDDLLAFSRAGRVKGEVASIQLADLVHGCTQLLDLSGRHSVSIAFDIEQLTGHETPLETVIRNLIGNAVKHHDRDVGKIVVSSSAAQEHPNLVRITVADDGPGIDPGLHDRAFVMFQTLKPRDEVEGSGMGLALVKKLVEAEGGRVWIEANDPRGTRVCFTWPLDVS